MGERARGRAVYERAVAALEGEPGCEALLTKFAQFEEHAKEFEARDVAHGLMLTWHARMRAGCDARHAMPSHRIISVRSRAR